MKCPADLQPTSQKTDGHRFGETGYPVNDSGHGSVFCLVGMRRLMRGCRIVFPVRVRASRLGERFRPSRGSAPAPQPTRLEIGQKWLPGERCRETWFESTQSPVVWVTCSDDAQRSRRYLPPMKFGKRLAEGSRHTLRAKLPSRDHLRHLR